MDVFGALVLFIVLYIVLPLAVCIAALVLLGGAERLLPGGTRTRPAPPRAEPDHH
jgi:hypothetical protein